MQSNESSETSETSTAQPSNDRAERSGFAKLQALLKEDRPETADEGDAGESQQNAEPEAGKPPKSGKPKALKDLAERLNVAPEDLYAIEIPLGGDGKTVKLSELKDTFAKQDDLNLRELQLEERRSKQEAEWTRAQQELEALMGQLDPKAIKPEVREAVKKKIEANLKRERELTLKTIPEWANETVREADLAGMTDLLKDYGISEQFLSATMNHKLFRFVRDAYLRKSRMEKALAKVAEVKKPSMTGKSGGGNGAARKPDTSSSSTRLSPRERMRVLLNTN